LFSTHAVIYIPIHLRYLFPLHSHVPIVVTTGSGSLLLPALLFCVVLHFVYLFLLLLVLLLFCLLQVFDAHFVLTLPLLRCTSVVQRFPTVCAHVCSTPYPSLFYRYGWIAYTTSSRRYSSPLLRPVAVGVHWLDGLVSRRSVAPLQPRWFVTSVCGCAYTHGLVEKKEAALVSPTERWTCTAAVGLKTFGPPPAVVPPPLSARLTFPRGLPPHVVRLFDSDRHDARQFLPSVCVQLVVGYGSPPHPTLRFCFVVPYHIAYRVFSYLLLGCCRSVIYRGT